jgi:hypothetical protein
MLMRLAALSLLLLCAVPTCGGRQAPDGTYVAGRTRVLPPIPNEAPTALGPIPIHKVSHLTCGGIPAYGCFRREPWIIEIRSDSVSLLLQWESLEHELFHADMQVAGIEFDQPKDEDQIAEGAAQGRVLRMRAGWPR